MNFMTPRARAVLFQNLALLMGSSLSLSGCGGGDNPTGVVNRAPVATTASLSTLEDTVSTAVTPSVTDPDSNDTFTFTVLGQGRNGTATVVGQQLVYTPDANFNGSDSFTYRATDAGGLSVTGTASVEVVPVNDVPSATGGSKAIFVGASGTRYPWVDEVDLWDSASFQVLTQPTSGSVSFTGSQWTYTPAGTGGGTDSFTYQATDGGSATVNGTARVRLYDAAALAECTRNSTVNLNGTLGVRTKSNACTYYSSTQTRTTPDGTAVTMDYFGHGPSNGAASKAVVVLIGGGNFNLNLSGDSQGVAAPNGGGNFLVRSAQLFAEAGYTAVALDRPTDQPPAGSTDSIADADRYRISVNHAVDIVKVLKHANSRNLDVFIIGTSRGAISAVSQNRIAAAVGISSPVTSNAVASHLYLGRPDTPSLLAGFVQRPALVSWHEGDLCPHTPPVGTQTFYNGLIAAGVSTSASIETGGVRVTAASGAAPNTIEPDVCGAFDHHGYLGIETTAVGHMTQWLDGQVAALAGNKRPEAAFSTAATPAGAPRTLDLARLSRDGDGDTLAYALSHTSTTLGGTVSINGATVTYTPPPGVSNRSDHFVYIVTDGKGGVGAAVITVQIGN